MAASEGGRAGNARRFAAVLGGVAAAAVCVSFAWSLVGGAAPAASPAHAEPVVESASRPLQPPLFPPRPPLRPRLSAKFVVDDVRTSPSKCSPAEKAAALPPKATAAQVSSTVARKTPTDTLLLTESKASRTRGQPAQA